MMNTKFDLQIIKTQLRVIKFPDLQYIKQEY